MQMSKLTLSSKVINTTRDEIMENKLRYATRVKSCLSEFFLQKVCDLDIRSVGVVSGSGRWCCLSLLEVL